MTYYHSPLIQNLSLLLWWKCRISTFYGARPTFDTLRVQIDPAEKPDGIVGRRLPTLAKVWAGQIDVQI
jgi:hypothetical protein